MKSKWNDLLYGKFKRPKKWMLEKDLSFSSDLTKEDIKKFKDAKVDVKITATGKISTHQKRSGYNLIIENINALGEGELLKLIDQFLILPSELLQ